MPMSGENFDKGLASRYITKKTLGNYPPWAGFSVTDSLSEKSYLMFALHTEKEVPLSLVDLEMRMALFTGEIFASALSLQKTNNVVSFLLPYTSLVPLTKALPSMDETKIRETMTELFSDVLPLLEKGYYFGNLAPESIVMADNDLVILPTAYLLPFEMLAHLRGKPILFGGLAAALCRDLDSIGNLLDTFSLYLHDKASKQGREISKRLHSSSPDMTGEDCLHLIDDLITFVGLENLEPFVPPGLIPSFIAPKTAMNLMKKAAEKAAGGENQLVIIKGDCGEGRSRFVREAARLLAEDWSFERGVILSDQSLFQDMDIDTIDDGYGFVVIDDHSQEPLVSCHIIDRLCRNLESCSLNIIVVNNKSPDYFVSALIQECRRKNVSITQIPLTPLSRREKGKVIESIAVVRKKTKAKSEESPLFLMVMEEMISSERDGKRAPESLSSLTDEDRSILNFIAVFNFEMPLKILQNVFSTSGNGMYESVMRLRALGLVEARAENSVLSDDEISMLYNLSGRTLADYVLKKIPKKRREQIHRNIALILEEIENAPMLYIFHHLAHGGDKELAATKGYELFKSLLERENLSAINCFNESYLHEKLDMHLPAENRFNLLLELGNYFSLIGNIERAEQFYRRCREDISSKEMTSEFRTITVEAARKECEILEKRGEFLKAEKLLDRTLESHGEHLRSNERAKLYNDLAWVHYRLGLFDKSHENCLLVHKLLNEKKYPLEIAQTYNLMGTINWNRSQYEDAVTCHRKCLALRERCNEEIGVSTSYNNLGLVYRSMGKLNEALDCFKKSMEIKKRHNNLPGLAAAYLNIALVYLDLEQLDDAEKSCLTATRLAEDIGNQQLLAEIYGTLGEIHLLKGRYNSARDYFYKDLHICQKTKSQREKAVVFRRLCELALEQGSYEESRKLLEQANSLNKVIGSRLESCLTNILEARLMLAEGKREQGKRLLEGVNLELSLLGRKTTAVLTAAEIGHLFLEEGNEPLAREYLLRAISLLGDSENIPGKVQTLIDALDSESAKSLDQIKSDSDRFKVLCRLTSIIRTIHNPEKLYSLIVETAMKITGMKRAALILQEEETESYRILAASGVSSKQQILPDSNVSALLDIAKQLGYPLDVSKVTIPGGKVSETFLKEHPSIICIPLWIEDEVPGFLYLDSTRKTAGTKEEDHSFLIAFSQQVALGLEKILLSERIKNIERDKPIRPSVVKTKERENFKEIVGTSPAIKHIFKLIDDIKDMDMSVLLIGENGTGKDLFAKAIHYNSHRRNKPFVSLNCATIPRELIASELFGHEKGSFTGAHLKRIGHFESARDGTIFLNEIRDLPLQLQPTLLRVLEEQKFYSVGGREVTTNARIIAATNVDLLELIKKQQFRIDLYHRLNIFPIRIPALRDRKEDIEPLCNHFLATYCNIYNIPLKTIAQPALAHFFAYDWPGNVRELENVINRLVITSKRDTILVEDLPDNILSHARTETMPQSPTLEDAVENLLETIDSTDMEPSMQLLQYEIAHQVYERTGSVQETASVLKVSKPTVYKWLRMYDEKKNE